MHRSTRLAHQINLALERRVLRHADQVLFTSARTLELVMRKYPASWRSRAAVLAHAWDLDHFAPPLALSGATPANAPVSEPCAPPAGGRSGVHTSVPDDALHDVRHDTRHVVRHIGACHGERSPRPLFDALARIAARSPRRLDDVRFELIGPLDPAFLRTPAFKALPPGLVSVRGPVGYRAALQLASAASALLVIEAPSAVESVFLPTKLIDYITPAGAGAELIAKWTGAYACADPADPATVAGMLLSGIDGLDFQPPCYGSDRIALRYAPNRVAQTLKQYLRHAIGRRVGARAGARADPVAPWVGARVKCAR